MQFEFATAARVLFGPGRLGEIGVLVRGYGTRALVVTGRTVERASRLIESLTGAGIDTRVFPVAGEPSLEAIDAGVEVARENRCQCVIGFGGGSAIDAGKAIAVMLTNPGAVTDYLEVIGKGRSLSEPGAPCVAIPTTAGTGAEVTRNAVLYAPEHRVKASLRSVGMLPRMALVDPELTYDLPPPITAATGLDALTQLLEAFVSVRANPMTDAVCREGLRRAARSLRGAFAGARRAAAAPGDATEPERAARADMALAGLLSGMALANAGLGAVHGFAAALGGMFKAPHGAVCAALLPGVMTVNARALRGRAADGAVLGRFDEIARVLTGEAGAPADAGADWVRETCHLFEIPPLRVYGMKTSDIPAVIERATQASSMKGNPIVLTTEELAEILSRAL